jgi:UDP-apiose/xylose synthase
VDGGQQQRSFTDIREAVDAIMIILNNMEGAFDRQICNVGNPDNEITMAGLAELMLRLYREITGHPAKTAIKIVSGREFYGEGYQDCDRRIPDVTKMRRQGWLPRIGLEETLKNILTYYLELRKKENAAMKSLAS